MIQRDIARTFPAHDFFKEAGGLGQDSLYRVSKAYAIYDAEVGYCQGLSFVAATLLLHVSYSPSVIYVGNFNFFLDARRTSFLCFSQTHV